MLQRGRVVDAVGHALQARVLHDAVDDPLRVVDAAQVHAHDAVAERPAAPQVRGHAGGHPGLPDPAGAGDRDQLGTSGHQVREIGQNGRAPDEAVTISENHPWSPPMTSIPEEPI
jgi:hypothetical protein